MLALYQWIEWEATSLRPSAYLGSASGGDTQPLTAAAAHLAAALQKGPGPFLLGAQLSAADLLVHAALLPLQLQGSLATLVPEQHKVRGVRCPWRVQGCQVPPAVLQEGPPKCDQWCGHQAGHGHRLCVYASHAELFPALPPHCPRSSHSPSHSRSLPSCVTADSAGAGALPCSCGWDARCYDCTGGEPASGF